MQQVISDKQEQEQELIKARVPKQSISPDKYQINNNLVVDLADPIKKPNELQIKMNQT